MMISISLFVLGNLIAQSIPSNRDLYVAVWKFAEDNDYQGVNKYKSKIEAFSTLESYKTGNDFFNFKKGNYLDLVEDEYKIYTMQIDKILMSRFLYVFEWIIKNDNGNLSVKLNNTITSEVDKDGNWTPTSEFRKSNVSNAKQIEKNAAKELSKYLTVSDEEFKKLKKEVSTNIDFLVSVIPNMTEMALEDFIKTNEIYDAETTITLKVSDVKKNTSKLKGYTPDKYAYCIDGIYYENVNYYIHGFTNSSAFNKAKKDTIFTCKGKIKFIEYKLSKLTINFVVE